jgi:hypothetical protein
VPAGQPDDRLVAQAQGLNQTLVRLQAGRGGVVTPYRHQMGPRFQHRQITRLQNDFSRSRDLYQTQDEKANDKPKNLHKFLQIIVKFRW